MFLLIGEKFLIGIKKCEEETFDLSKNLSWANHLHLLMDFPIPSPQIFPWNVLLYISFAFHHKSYFVFFFNNLFRAVSIVSPGSSNPPGNPNLPSNLNKALLLFVCLKMVLPKMHVYEGIVRMLIPKFFFGPATIVNWKQFKSKPTTWQKTWREQHICTSPPQVVEKVSPRRRNRPPSLWKLYQSCTYSTSQTSREAKIFAFWGKICHWK